MRAARPSPGATLKIPPALPAFHEWKARPYFPD
jgi:hypothetical protein